MAAIKPKSMVSQPELTTQTIYERVLKYKIIELKKNRSSQLEKSLSILMKLFTSNRTIISHMQYFKIRVSFVLSQYYNLC